jgi:hypothetical protein
MMTMIVMTTTMMTTMIVKTTTRDVDTTVMTTSTVITTTMHASPGVECQTAQWEAAEEDCWSPQSPAPCSQYCSTTTLHHDGTQSTRCSNPRVVPPEHVSRQRRLWPTEHSIPSGPCRHHIRKCTCIYIRAYPNRHAMRARNADNCAPGEILSVHYTSTAYNDDSARVALTLTSPVPFFIAA